jgi:hypothetical protein
MRTFNRPAPYDRTHSAVRRRLLLRLPLKPLLCLLSRLKLCPKSTGKSLRIDHRFSDGDSVALSMEGGRWA